MSKAREEADAGVGDANLTPMIDMVFQLIIFFVIVNDFSQTVEPVVLAEAINASTDKTPTQDRSVVINILPDGTIKILGRVYGGPGIDPQVLKDHLKIEAEIAGMEPNPESPGKSMSNLRVVIRADQSAAYEHVQKVFKACAENFIYKTIISALKEELQIR